MLFNCFNHKYKIKHQATSNIKFQQVLLSTSLIDVGIYLRNVPFSSDIRIVNLNTTKGTHWVCYINEKNFDSYGCVCPKKVSKITI